MSTPQGSALTRGARGIGGLVCLLLALLGTGWIIRDLSVAQQPADVWWTWLGEPRRPREFTAWATCALDPLLVLGALAAAVASVRDAVAPAVAAGGLFAMAVGTALLRLPLLWVLGAGWLQGLDSGLTGQARLTAIVQLALSAVLLVVLVAGRKPAHRPQYASPGLPRGAQAAYGVVGRTPHGPTLQRPGGPRKGPAVAAGWALGVAGAAVAAWEVHWWLGLGWDTYRKGLIGDASVFRALLQPPVHWQALVLALLAVPAAVGAIRRAPWARPVAMVTGALLASQGAATLVFAAHTGQLARFAVLPAASRLELGTGALVAVAGLVALTAAARSGVPAGRTAPGSAAAVYGPAAGAERPRHAPPPPSTLPPGW
ncbi:hypothetical protein [Streptomyces sp. NPDC017993]|uniref:hypothetical protein n=1 Tax=Streptomyces sp. NPDC017993 TaxID=3365027 RepID=UPI0037A24029